MPSIEGQAQAILDSLPVSFRLEAESVRAMGERERWQSGHAAADLVDELYPRYPKAAIRLAMALLYHVTDATIRDREYVCRRIPAPLRALYPSLTFHYWRACAQSRDAIDLAEQIVAHLRAYGRLPSVNSVYGWVKGDGNGVPVWVLRVNALFDRMDKIKSDPLLPSEIAAVMVDFESQLEAALFALVSERAEDVTPQVIERLTAQVAAVA